MAVWPGLSICLRVLALDLLTGCATRWTHGSGDTPLIAPADRHRVDSQTFPGFGYQGLVAVRC